MIALILSALVPGLILLRLALNALRPGLTEFPGPWAAKFTDSWRLWEVYMERKPITLNALHKKYGIAVRTGPNIIDISDPALIGPVCGSKGDFVKVVKDGKRTEFITDAQDKAVHAKIKNPIAGVYSMKNSYLLEPLMDDTIEFFVTRLAEKFVLNDRICDIHNWVQYFAFDIISTLTFNHRLGLLDAGGDVNGMLASLQKEFDYRAIIGQMPWLDNILKKNPLWLRFIHPTNPIAERTAKLLQRRAAFSPETTCKDLYSSFLEVKAVHAHVTDTTVMRYAMNTIVAGADTTAVIIRSILYYTLRSNSSTLKRLQTEIDSAALRFPPKFQSIQNLPYLSAVIREGFRLHPAPGFSLERIVPPAGIQLCDGRKLPGGCIIALNQWALHRTPSIFGEDSETFRPERWLRGDESEDEIRKRLAAMNGADFSFSSGSRACLGRHVAQMEVYKTIATLFGLFYLELVTQEPWTVRYGFTARQSDMDVRIRWRKGADIGELAVFPVLCRSE